MNEFIIQSVKSDLALVFSDRKGDYFKAHLRAAHLNATREVYAYTDSDGLAKLLERLASQEKPWPGKEAWQSLEGEFKLTVTCNVLGHVTFNIILSHTGRDEEWSVETDLLCEFGQLQKLAKSAKAFFS